MNASIRTLLNKVRMRREIVPFPVFQDKIALLLQQLLLKDIVRQQRQLRQRVRRICKDKIKPQRTSIQILKHIATYYG